MRIPHLKYTLMFGDSAFGPGNCEEVREEIRRNGTLREPTFTEKISFIYDALIAGPKGLHASKIRDILEYEGFWGYTPMKFVPNKEAFVQGKRLEIPVPFGYETGELSLDKFARHPLIIAISEGEENADKLAQIAAIHRANPVIESYKNVAQEVIVPAISLYMGKGGLVIGCVNYDDSQNNAYAFGIQPSTEDAVTTQIRGKLAGLKKRMG